MRQKPLVKYHIFEDSVAGLWVVIPLFGIGPGWDCFVGGALQPDAIGQATTTLCRKIEERCQEIVGGKRDSTHEMKRVAQEILQFGFDIEEDTSIKTSFD